MRNCLSTLPPFKWSFVNSPLSLDWTSLKRRPPVSWHVRNLMCLIWMRSATPLHLRVRVAASRESLPFHNRPLLPAAHPQRYNAYNKLTHPLTHPHTHPLDVFTHVAASRESLSSSLIHPTHSSAYSSTHSLIWSHPSLIHAHVSHPQLLCIQYLILFPSFKKNW